ELIVAIAADGAVDALLEITVAVNVAQLSVESGKGEGRTVKPAAYFGRRLEACGGLIATTFGANGAELRRNGQAIARAIPPPVSAVDATGAGDTFTAALVVALVEDRAPENALQFACAAGATATTRRGAQPSLPSREDVEALLP
ncbi:MAG: PfkB family carbohydrate kinase, partial [Woeseiaceae bacterium]